jgi:chromosome segregation ATPase
LYKYYNKNKIIMKESIGGVLETVIKGSGEGEKPTVVGDNNFMYLDFSGKKSNKTGPAQLKRPKIEVALGRDDDDIESENVQVLSEEERVLVVNILNKHCKKLGIGNDQINNFYNLATNNPELLLSTISNLQREVTNSILEGDDRHELSKMYNELEASMKSIDHLSQEKSNFYYRSQVDEMIASQRRLNNENIEVMADLVNTSRASEELKYLLTDAKQNLEINKAYAQQKAMEVEGLRAKIDELKEQQDLLLGIYRQSSEKLGSARLSLEEEIKKNSESVKDLKEQLELEQNKNEFLQRYVDNKQNKNVTDLIIENNLGVIPDTKPNLVEKPTTEFSSLVQGSKPISEQGMKTAIEGLKKLKQKPTNEAETSIAETTDRYAGFEAGLVAQRSLKKIEDSVRVPSPVKPLAAELSDGPKNRKEIESWADKNLPTFKPMFMPGLNAARKFASNFRKKK